MKLDGTTFESRRIGVFGGSFDPVHLGHTGLALDAMKLAQLDRVIFVPAKRQPFKLDKTLLAGDARMDMLKIATAGNDRFEISSFELDAEGISYTYLTMRAIQRMYGENIRLCFITGTDAFLKIEKWRNAEELLTEYSYIIGTRPGYKQEELALCIEQIRKKYHTEVTRIENRQLDVSSTEIRRRIRQGISAEGLLAADVEKYIKENGLYG